jgi:glycosyltransferase involved in cell wall biosynthesis
MLTSVLLLALLAPTLPRAQNGASTDVGRLVEGMGALLDDRALAARLGAAAREVALERFSIARFGADWTAAFALVTGRSGG